MFRIEWTSPGNNNLALVELEPEEFYLFVDRHPGIRGIPIFFSRTGADVIQFYPRPEEEK